MIIKENILFEGSKGDINLLTLFDTGSTFSCVREDLIENIEVLTPLKEPLMIETASEGQYIKVYNRVLLTFYLNEVKLSDEFLVVRSLSEDAFLGITTLQKWKIKLDFEHDIVIVDPKVAKAILK